MSSTYVSDQVSSTNESVQDSVSSPTNYTLTEHEIARIRNKYLPSCRDFQNGEMGNFKEFNMKISNQSLLDRSVISSNNKPHKLSKVALTNKISKTKSKNDTKSDTNNLKEQQKRGTRRNKSISFLSNQLYKDILLKKKEALNIFDEVSQKEVLECLKNQRKSLISQHSLLVTANKTKDDRNEDKTTELQNELDQVIQVLHKIIQELLADRDSTLEKLKIAKQHKYGGESPDDSFTKKYKKTKAFLGKSLNKVCSLSVWKTLRDAVVTKTNQYLNKNSSSNNEKNLCSSKYRSEYSKSSPYAEIGSYHAVYTREHHFDNSFGGSSRLKRGSCSSTTVDTLDKSSLRNNAARRERGVRLQSRRAREQIEMC